MAKRKKTTKAVTRDNVTLNSVFTDIANAIRAKTGGSDPISPMNMGNAIRGLNGITEASLPEANLPAVFQDIADAIRACGITGTMTASQMAGKIGDIVSITPETRVKYTASSGLSDWSQLLSGTIYSANIPNCQYMEKLYIGTNVTGIYAQGFFDMNSLTHITIPSNITSIGYTAFRNSNKIQEITFLGRTKNQVTSMSNYSWGVSATSDSSYNGTTIILKCTDGDITLTRYYSSGGSG